MGFLGMWRNQDVSQPLFKVSTPAKTQIARAFGLKAQYYDANAFIQKELLSRLDFQLIEDSPEKIWADLGCGTGMVIELLRQKGICSQLLGIDIAFASLRILKSRGLRNTFSLSGDIEYLPLKNNSLDGVIMTSVLQWFSEPSAVLKNISDLLKSKGILLFATFTEGSFVELNSIKKELGFPIPVFLPNQKNLCSSLKKAGFSILKTDIFASTLYFPTAFRLLKSLSAIGGTAVTGNRLSRSALFDFCKKFEENFQSDKGVPISYRALIGSARKG